MKGPYNNGLERTRRVGVPASRAVIRVSPCRSTRCSVGLRMRPDPMAAWSRPGQDGPSLDPQKFRLKKGPQPGEGANTLTTLACRYDAVRRRHHGPLKRLLRAASDRQAHRLGKMPPFPAGAGTQFAGASVAASLGHQPSAHPAQQGAANGTANNMRFNRQGSQRDERHVAQISGPPNNGLERTRRVGVPAARAVIRVSPCRSTRCSLYQARSPIEITTAGISWMRQS